jgi:hypothetical protein
MKRTRHILIALFALGILSSNTKGGGTKETSVSKLSLTQREAKFNYYAQSIYECIGDSSINEEAFNYALKGHYALKNAGKLKNENELVLIDFTKSSADKRFFIIDLEDETILYKKRVAHGKKSGEVYPTKFSNISESHMSSIGFYVTGNTYNGKYDNSLVIQGQEYTNSKAEQRGVVIHSADYVTEKYLERNGRLGRSYGCPALPHEDYAEIIDVIKEGTTLFIYYEDKKYLSSSKLLKAENFLKRFY